MPVESLANKAARTRKIISRLRRTHPDARLALVFHSPFELLVALILAAQCTDQKVNEVTSSLFEKYRSPEDVLRASPQDLEADIRPTGFFRSKAKAIRGCCRALVDRHGGDVPAHLDDLLSLPGVGRKTANILLGNAFGQPALGVDTHVMRLSQRLGLSRRTDPDKIEADLTRLVPRQHWIRFCHLMQFHGRRVCLARAPKCSTCTIAALCPYPQKTPPAGARPGARRATPSPVWFRRSAGARAARPKRSQRAENR
jgi:endonuclease-3